MANLSFTHGTVGSSKTANLLMEKYTLENNLKKNVLLLKPSVDTRDDVVHSRVGLSAKCYRLSENEAISAKENDITVSCEAFKKTFNDVDVVMVDEAQFLTKSQVEDLYDIASRYDIPVKTYGLYTDFRREFFEGSKALVELADEINKIDSLCPCGCKALANARYVDGVFTTKGSVVGIEHDKTDGMTISYVPLCKNCYETEKDMERQRECKKEDYPFICEILPEDTSDPLAMPKYRLNYDEALSLEAEYRGRDSSVGVEFWEITIKCSPKLRAFFHEEPYTDEFPENGRKEDFKRWLTEIAEDCIPSNIKEPSKQNIWKDYEND